LDTAFKPENLESIKLRIAIKIRVFDISNQTAAAVDMAPPMGQNHGPGSDNSPTQGSKTSNGKEFDNRTSPPSRVPAIWLTVSESLINLPERNLTNKPTARTLPVRPMKKLAPVPFIIPDTSKSRDNNPNRI
jgi:hypothetical protein